MRVSYSVTATDATDGTVAATCLPKSGSLFPVGRMTVTCNADDSSGNAMTARFVVTVKRVRR
jgi:HYR domain